MNTPVSRRLGNWLAVPWSGFVAAFIYYALAAAVLLGGAAPPASWVFVAYLAPLLAYSVIIAARLPALVVAYAPRRHAVRLAVS